MRAPDRDRPAAPAAPRECTAAPEAGCAQCSRFIDDPRELEALFSGLAALSSAFGSTRGSAGICELDGTFHDPVPACADFVGRGGRGAER